ncbi:MAG: hypothetical protein PHC83_09730, partial [Bacteroidales bacterium]|nr:hypothetical protein [Bacteroidales bacterium]
MNKNIWFVSKYAGHPKYGNPTRQYFFSKYFSQKGHRVTLVSSRSVDLNYSPKMGLKNHLKSKDV